MIEIRNNFRSKYRSLVKKAREEKIRCVRLRPGLYYVARKAKGHGEYLVTINETKTAMTATCRKLYGAACPSFGCCVHVITALERSIQLGRKRKQESEAA